MRDSLENDSCCSALKARALFATQIPFSVVAIPFLLIAAIFLLFWKLLHGEFKDALLTIPAAIIHSGHHITYVVASIIGSLSPMAWTNKAIDCFEFERPASPAPEVVTNV
jgi:hypothetical protein